MTRDDIARWIGTLPVDAFSLGAVQALFGDFNEADCAPAGAVDESNFCEGAREVLVRLRQVAREQGEADRASRLRHGEVVEVG